MLVDSATIFVRSGKGGDGCVSFHRAKYVPKGGPNGGDGGDGGDVVLHATPNVATLLDFAGRHHWRAEDGQPGTGKQCHGKSGQNLVIELPVGTAVYDENTGELLVDLDEPDMRYPIAKGGRGGFGNEHFKSATNQTPREATPGEPGEEFNLRLELKLVADVGLVGKPNAGKSTLISSVSRATPKVADYPFTTLEPNLGIAELPGHRRLVIADIPGLIEGASDGAGLGHRFLRHIERTRIIVHLVEVEPFDGSDPVENYRVIQQELEQYSKELADKPVIVALSKMDLLQTPEDWATAVELFEKELGCPVLPLSSASEEGLDDLLEACWNHLPDRKRDVQWEAGEKKA